MSFLSGIVGGIEHLFGGGNNNNQQQKKKQQQNNQPANSPQNVNQGHNQPTNQNPQQPDQIAPQNQVNLTSLNPNALQKVNPGTFGAAPTSTTATTQAAPAQHASIFHDITHNPITNAVGAAAKATAGVATGATLGVTRAAEGIVGGATQIPRLALDAGTYLGDKLSGTNYKPGFVTAVDKATNIINTPINALAKKTDQAINDVGGVAKAVYKPVQVATNVATVVPGVAALAAKAGQLSKVSSLERAGSVVGDFVNGQKAASPVLNAVDDAKNLVKTKISGAPASPSALLPDEVAPGIKPTQTQLQEGASQTPAPLQPEGQVAAGTTPPPEVAPVAAEQGPQISQEAPNVKQPEPVQPPAPDPLAPQPIVPNALNDHETASLSQLNKDSKVRVLTPEEKTTQTALQAKSDQITAANNPEPVIPAKGASTAQNAPGIRQALNKRVDDTGANVNLKSVSNEHEVLSNQNLNDAAQQYNDNLSDGELVDAYRNGATFNNAGDIAKGSTALQRLGDLSAKGNTDANTAIDNILDGAERAGSEGGRTLNYVQSFYDSLPAPAKTSYIIRQMDKIREDAGLPLFRDNVDLKSEVQSGLDTFLKKDESFKQAIADLENEASTNKNNLASGAVKGNSELTARGNTLNNSIAKVKLDESKNTSDLAKFYDKNAPPKVGLETKAGNFARSLMLSSPTGRANDVITTAINASHSMLVDNTSAALGKVANAARAVAGKSPGKYDSTFVSPKAIGRGIVQGAKQSVARFKGDLNSSDASTLIKSKPAVGGKGGLLQNSSGKIPVLSKVVGGINNTVRSATEIATDLSEGVKQAKIQEYAAKEGKQLGLKGADLKSYTSNRTAAPSREAVEAGKKVQTTVNNMQDNPITNALQHVSNGATHIPVVGQTLKNLTLPFTRWTGGQMWNSLVDNNSLVNAGRVINAMRKGDAQEAVRQASRLGVNSVATAGVGYKLAQSGLLTHTNAQGYNDDGTYLHVDGRHIPAGFLGFYAPGLILGQATHDVLNGKDKSGNMAQKIANITAETLVNSAKASGVRSLTGEENPILQSYLNHQGAKSTAETAAAGVVSQYLPATGNDINAVINNGIPGIKGSDALNPTHEAALTKVTNPNSKSGKAKDVEGTIKNQLINKIPFASQTLPRKVGVAAPDLVDRVTRGDRDTQIELKKAADAKVVVDKQAANAKAGIPDPTIKYKDGDSFDQAVENRVENKKYDQAIGGLQQKLDQVKNAPDSTTRKTDPIAKQLATVKVLKQGNYDPAIRDQYSKVSLDEWRNLGDPKSDTYDPATYQKLFAYDKALAASDASSNSNDNSQPKYSAKTSTAAERASAANKAASAAASLIKNNTVGSTPNLPKFSYGSLAPQKITDANAKLPTIQQIPSSQLIKKRTISVSARA